MLLQTCRLEVINNHCMPGAQSVNCIARLNQDVGCAIPYLNAVIESDQFTCKSLKMSTFVIPAQLIRGKSTRFSDYFAL
jgi:hypothetical protein